MPALLDNNMFDIPIGVVNQQNFKVSHDRVSIRRDAEVGEVMKPLEKKYPGSYLTLNNKLTQLQEDDIVEEVFTEGDVLTGLKMKHNVERNGVKWCDKPAGDIVVLSNLITKQPLVVESKYEQKFQFKPAEFSSTVSIFWKQWDETSRVVEEDKEEITREERMVGEDAVLLGKKYLIPQMTDEEGETWHQFKVTRDKEHPSLGVRLVGPNEKEIPALGTDQKEDLQGVFYRPVGPDFPLEFHNDAGQDLQVVIGAKFGFQLVEVPSGERRKMSLTANHRGRHTFGLAPSGQKEEVTATMFELSYLAREQGEVIRINPGLTADLVTEDQGDLPVQEVEKGRIFREADNARLGNLFDWVERK